MQDKEESTKSKGKHKKHVLKRSPVSKPEELEVIAAYNVSVTFLLKDHETFHVHWSQLCRNSLYYQTSKMLMPF